MKRRLRIATSLNPSTWSFLCWALATLLTFCTGCKRSAPTPEPPQDPKSIAAALASGPQAAEIQSRLEAIRSAGYPITLQELNRWIPMPPPGENTALKWTNAFAALVSLTNSPTLPYRDHWLTPQVRPVLEQIVATNQVALRALHEVAMLPGRGRYILHWSAGWKTELPHLRLIKHAAQVLQSEAVLRAGDGRKNETMASLRALAALARSQEEEPCEISQLVRAVVLTYLHKATEVMINHNSLSPSELAQLQELFQSAQQSEAAIRALVGERCLYIHLLLQQQQEIIATLKEGAESGFMPCSTNQIPTIVNDFAKARGTEFVLILNAMDNLISASGQAPTQFLQALHSFTTQIAEQAKQPNGPTLSTVLMSKAGGHGPHLIRLVQILALCRTAETAMALERYRLGHRGQLPPTLNTLASVYLNQVPLDPFDGQPIRYKRLPKGYAIYSVGKDGRDDGAQPSDSDGTGDETFVVER